MDKSTKTRREKRREELGNKTVVDIAKLKVEIRDNIQSKYSMNVNEFSASKQCEKLLGKNSKNLNVYLSAGDVTSFGVLKKLAEHFSLGNLKKETVIKRQVIYTYEEDIHKGDKHSSIPNKKVR